MRAPGERDADAAQLPDWLTRILLGSAKAPTYWTPETVPGEVVADDITDDYHEAVARDRQAIYGDDGK